MFNSYLRIGWRNLVKNKLFSVINISGMAISMTSFLIISLFVYDELKFDKHIEDVNLKYRIFNEHFREGRDFAIIPAVIAPTLAAEYPEVEYFTRFMNLYTPPLFEVRNKKFTEDKGGLADPSFFKMFSLELIEGNANNALKKPNEVGINKTLKEKYFGESSALGQSIKINGEDYNVTAVFEDFPKHTHLDFNYLIAMEELATARPDRMSDWGWSGMVTYIKLKPGTNTLLLESKIKDIARGKADEEDFYTPHLMPLKDVHLHAYNQSWDVARRGNIQTVYVLIATSIFILVIAILNFVNLSTARAVSRVKEVGLRKVVGAVRIQLIYQFISESVIIAFIALIIGVTLASAILPSLNSFADKDIPVHIFLEPQLVVALMSLAILTGIAAGSYPAFYISGFRPASILANRLSGGSESTLLRKGLVVLQFVLAFFLIVASLTVSQQYNYMRNTDMGFNKDNLIVLQLRGEMFERLETTKQTLVNHPNILSATLGYGLPGEAYAGETIKDKATNKEYSVSMLTADHDYVKTVGLELLAGRDFSKEIATDEQQAFILSESAIKMLGYDNPEDALQHEIDWQYGDSLKRGKVIGVVKDVQLNSMRESITPVVLHIFKSSYSSVTLRIKPTDVSTTLSHLKKSWSTLTAEWPFEYKFLDDNFDKMYKSEEKLNTLFSFFTGFAILVACVGLLGLVIYTTSQKYKEISIRKVLGAGEGTLVIQLAKNYMLLLCVAFFIAIPFSYYASWRWLQEFTYRISITPTLFIKAGLFIMVISLLTVGLQSLKAARANPVDALKEQ
ncbi:ABC transporter permease [Chryseosolibacter indicus]|uniref:ABC transporter permease n=1 Tax=Chryseosolibacter indicus TaxID=2782351 RepID=A0ABS5VP22_9BACT|nr:ABC transporter permease [Chryseosolibacter indicus]MBT1702547.1 ABC transporter permease [Chryseosolibacter indicus]